MAEAAVRRGLEVRDLRVQFAGLRALDDLSFRVAPAEMVGLIGPNGAGKSTALNAISRIIQPSGGSIAFDGRDLLALAAHRLADLGIARVFQHPQLCRELSARENVLLGFHHRVAANPLLSLFGGGRSDPQMDAEIERTLAFCEIAEWSERPAGSLPYGVQKRVELARALAIRPSLLILDEPAAGLTAGERDDLVRMLRSFHADTGVSVLIVEHDIDLITSLVDRLVVLDFGRLVTEGPPAEVMAHAEVIRAYLGGVPADA